MNSVLVGVLEAVLRVRDELSPALKEAQKNVGAFSGDAEEAAKSLDGFQRAMTVAATVGTFLGVALYELAVGSVRFLFGEFRKGIDLSAEFTTAFIGLQSIANAFGVDADAARAAAASLAEDGLMKVSEAAQGLKNLLMSGFNLDQSIQLMNAFKDSAAFGRQASLDFGHAVVTATEGIKNQNSILVDNAGVTKNLSVIMKEAGFSVQDLSRVSSDASVRMALFNGLIRETAAMTGDAERLTQTYTGQVSRLTTQYEFLLGTMGAAITENRTVATAIGMVGDAVQGLNDDLVHQGQAWTFVSDATIAVVRGLQHVVTVVEIAYRAFHFLRDGIAGVVEFALSGFERIYTAGTMLTEWLSKIPGSGFIGLTAEEVERTQVNLAMLRSMVETFREAGEASEQAWQGNDAFVATLHRMQGALGESLISLEQTRGKTIEFGAATGRTRTDVEGLSEELSEAAKKAQKLAEELGGQKAIQAAQQWTEAVRQIGGVTRLSAEDQAKYNTILGEAIDAHERAGREVPSAMFAAFEATSKWREELVALEREVRAVPDSMQGMGGAINDVEINLLDAALAADRLHLELVQLESSGAPQVTSAIGNIGNAAGEAELAILEMRGELEKLKLQRYEEALQNLAGAFENLGDVIGGTAGRWVADIGGMATSLLDFAGASTKFLEGTAAIVQGVANVWAAIGGDQSKGESALSGALAGMQAGMAFGPWGAAIGAGAGALAGWWAGQSGPTQAELLEAQEMVRQWSQSVAGYFDEVSTAADRLRVGQSEAARTAEVVTRAYTDFGMSAQLATQNLRALEEAQRLGPEAVERVLTIITAQIERHQAVMKAWSEGVNTFMDGFEMRVEGIGLLADRIRANDEILQQGLAGSARSQEELIRLTQDLDRDTRVLQEDFQRLGEYAVIAFSVTLTQTGSLIEAFRQLQGPLNELIALQEEFGFEGSRAFERLKDIGGVITANQDLFTSIEALATMMDGLGHATLLTHDDMRIFGLDAVSLFDQMIARGIDTNLAMVAMQPTLQMLWEWQQKHGLAVDATTEALLNQAVQAGIVGEEQRNVHERMVEAIQLVEAAIMRLPEAFAQAINQARLLRYELDEMARIPGGPAMPIPDSAVYTGGTAVPRTEHDGGFVYHEGGYIPRAHSGMFLGKRLAHDEVPIIAQTGESVLNRAATAAIGGEAGVNAINGGGKLGGGTTINVHFHGGIQVGSSREFKRTVGQAFVESCQQDGEVWGTTERIVKQMVKA